MTIKNPYRPGAGFQPPHLAGRCEEIKVFEGLLEQEEILKNMLITGLRGVGKTVLLEYLKPIAISKKWFWVGSDWSESASISEDNLAIRILTDLSLITSNIVIKKEQAVGFYNTDKFSESYLTYDTLMALFQQIPGLTSDKLRTILEFVWSLVKDSGKGIIFAYDEAQFMADYASKEQYPLAVMLEVFQSIQRKGVRFMLVLVGLPTLVTKLVAARTYAERMFNITTLGKLDDKHSRDAILIPLKKESSSLGFTDDSVNLIIKTSDGYPYFIQFICREVFDIFIQRMNEGQSVGSVPMNEIVAKLDRDFFVARWNKATDRQKELLSLIANLDSAGGQFTIQEIVESAKKLQKPFGTSHVNQMLGTLINAGLIYKDKHGQYCFAVPLLADYIKRHPETI